MLVYRFAFHVEAHVRSGRPSRAMGCTNTKEASAIDTNTLKPHAKTPESHTPEGDSGRSEDHLAEDTAAILKAVGAAAKKLEARSMSPSSAELIMGSVRRTVPIPACTSQLHVARRWPI